LIRSNVADIYLHSTTTSRCHVADIYLQKSESLVDACDMISKACDMM